MNLVIADTVYGRLLQHRAVTGLPAEAQFTVTEIVVASITLADGEVVELRKPQVMLDILEFGELHSAVSLRRAPALFGLGNFEKVTLTDQGARFGWKAASTDLRSQIGQALSLDLGLGNPVHPVATGDCTETQTACLQAASAITGNELEAPELVLDLLLAYVRTLPPPLSTSEPEVAGEELFNTLGCQSCHIPTPDGLDSALRPYSDLGLHDMGPGLADALELPGINAAAWRTAPLWGLGQHSRYLHDGRASSLAEAIVWHGGEAQASALAYQELNAAQRQVLHAWLLGL
jgi:CxxC motif-containing protein (DUF1111 family)